MTEPGAKKNCFTWQLDATNKRTPPESAERTTDDTREQEVCNSEVQQCSDPRDCWGVVMVEGSVVFQCSESQPGKFHVVSCTVQ